MKKIRIRAAALVLTFLICFFSASEFILYASPAYAATDATVLALETKIKNIQSQKKDMLAKISAAKSDKAKATEYKNYIDQQMLLTADEMETINELLSELDLQISEKQNQIEVTSENIDEQYENFKQVMRLTYEEGDASYIEMVLGASDFYDFLVRVERVTSLMDYCSRLLETFRQNKTDLENVMTELESAKETQLTYKADLEERKKELDELQEENAGYLASLSRELSSYQSTYDDYVKAEEALDAELEKYLKELQAKENAQYVGGEFMWPLPAAWKSISSPYGYRTLFGVREFHRGIDIPASKNTPIYASNGGKVITATYHYSYGNYVVIDHGGGKSTLYAHANSLNVKVGDTVKQGDVIAYVGTTGNSTGYHLHFEVRINGTAQDPLGYVSKPK